MYVNGTLWALKCCITCICFISWKNFVSLNLPTLMFIKLDENRKEGHTMEWMLIKLLWDFDLKQYNTKLSLSIHIFTPYFSLIFLIWIEDPEHVLKKKDWKPFCPKLPEKAWFGLFGPGFWDSVMGLSLILDITSSPRGVEPPFTR